MARPTIPIPDWAITLANDGTTGQPNRAEPSAGKMVTGWDFNEKPPRQWFNWLQWATGQWITYLDSLVDQNVDSGSSPTFNEVTVSVLKTTNADITVEVNGISGNVILDPVEYTVFKTGPLKNTNGSFEVSQAGAVAAVSVASTGITVNALTVTGASSSIRGSATGITGAELETLSDGSNADSLHVHDISGTYSGLHYSGDQSFSNSAQIGFTSNLPSHNMTPNHSSDNITVLADGDYLIEFSALLKASVTDNWIQIIVQKNGGSPYVLQKKVYQNKTGADDYQQIAVSQIATLAVDDVITVSTGTSGAFSYVVTDATLIMKKL